MANKNLLLQSPTAGDIEEIFSQGADALTSAPVAAQGLPPQPAARTATPAPVQAPTPSRAAPTVADLERRAAELDIDPALARSFFTQESGSNWNSRDSSKGARGGMQVMPDTYKAMMGSYSGQRDPWNNMEAGLRYIAYGQKTLGTKDPALLAAGYHAGYDRKDLKAGKIPQGIGDGHISTADYAASVARRVGLGSGDLQAKLNKEEPGRYKVLTPAEAQDIERRQLQGTLDAEEPGRFKVLTDDDLAKLPASASIPPGVDDGTKKDGGSLLGDIARMGIGGVNKGFGQVVGGIGEAVKTVGDYTTTPLINKALGTNYRTGNMLGGVADYYKNLGERTQAGVSQESKAAIAESSPDGDLFKPSTWTFGKAPSLRGYALLGADVLGSMAPVVAASVASGGSAMVGGAVGAAQGGGAAADKARETIAKMEKDGTIADQSAYYRELVASGMQPQEAALRTQDAAARWALMLTAPVSGAGGALTAKIVHPATQIAGRANLPGRIAGRAAVGGAEEGVQEATETVQTQSGINRGAGADLSVTDGTFGDFVLGALGGGTTGAAGGALSSRTPAAAPAAQPQAQPRQDPTIDVTYQDGQGNTVTETVPGASTATPATAPTGPIGRAMEKAIPVQAAQPAPEAAAPAAPAQAEPVDMPRVRITAENGQTMTGFAERLGPDGSGRVIGDDGQVYQFTPADGVVIEQIDQQAAPADTVGAETAENGQSAIETEAENARQEPTSAKDDGGAVVGAEGADPAATSTAKNEQSTTENEAKNQRQETAEAGNTEKDATATKNAEAAPAEDAARPLTEWSEQELRDRMRYVTQQAKTNGGWTGLLTKERGRISREINRRNAEERRNTEAKNDQQPASNAVPDANVVPTGDQTAAPVQRDQPERSPVAEKPDVRSDAGQAGAREPELPVRTDVPGADAAADTQPALTGQPDAHAGKWFGSSEKADAYLTKKKASATHEVVKTGKVRWEIKPKAAQPAAEPEFGSPEYWQGKADAAKPKAAPAADPMYQQAVDTVMESGRASVALVQRTLKIGYNRAASLIESMELQGLVSPMKPDGSRSIITQDQPKAEKASTDADLDAMFDDAVAAKKQADAKAAPAAKTKAPAKPKAAPAARKEPRQGAVGMQLEAGEQVRTSSGRETTPFPKIDTANKGKTTNTLKRVDQWLMQNALDEATARGDDFNASQFEASKDKPSPADKDSAEEYLFGEQPAVVPSILRPLGSAAKNTAAGLTAAIDGLGELFGGSSRFSSGLTFDEETYAKAKPLFKQAVSHLGDAGSDLRQAMQAIVNMVMDKFGADVTQRMKPYVVRFVADVRDGKEDAAQDATDSAASSMDEAPQGSEKARVSELRKQLPAPKKGKAGISMEDAVAPGGADAIRFHVVDANGQKIGKTQMVRASTPEAELVTLMQRLLDDTLAQVAKFNKPKAAPNDVVRGKGESNAASAPRGVEQRGGQPATEPVLADGDGDATGAVRQRDIDGGRAGRGQDQGQQGDPGVSADRAPAHGDGSFVGVHRGDGAAEFAAVAAGSEFRERGSGIGDAGVPAEPYAAEAARAAADSPAKQRNRQRAQRAADGVKSAPGIDNIRATLQALLPAQQDDVAKTEARFAKPDGYGMLLTNGTGTGKTYSGLGVAKRFYRDGKRNILIVVPDEKVGSDWVDSAGDLLMDASTLADTKTAGDGVVVATYANLGQNNALASRAWDLVIADEAHKLMQGSKGEATAALDNLRAITMHPDGAYTRYQMQNAGDIATLQSMIAQQKENATADDALAAQIDALESKLSDARKKVQAEVADSQGEKRPRAMFLSATPFAYEKAVDWAQGYLFEYPKAEGTGYNSGDGQQRFMMQHFGYTMRYNKLTEPDSKVDRGLMQRNFNTWLKREGALSGRVLDVDADYDRRFVLIDSNVGNRIDAAFSWLDGQRRDATGEDGRVWQAMSKSLNDAFDYLSRRYLLEAIKAKESIPYVKGQLERGRKVVVFHDYKKGGGFNPFAAFARMDAPANLSSSEAAKFRAGLDRFRSEFGDLVAADWDGLGSAVSTYSEAFGNKLLVVNGDQKPRDNLARYKRFQDDASGPQVILVQSAKNAGWSGHDTTGKHQRVLLNLGLPTAPIMAIQQEGRIYRTGQASDAIMRYMNTGTSWEKTAFAATIAGRASTAENLGMGEDARALKDSFIAAFDESDAYPPGHEGEGTGGKERDRAANAALTEYDRAKAYYWATQKKNSKTKAQEGKDYFATPEPLGQKMVEWTDPRGGDKALEPSAGHGAIARWFGENVERTVVEPSTELRSRLSLVIDPANDRVVAANFEDLAPSNKYDVIAMNPPFGTAGRTAIDHLAKAAQHLRDRGRVVAIIPTGPAADKKFDAWLYEQSDKGQSVHGDLHLVADIKLPQSAFERAGTSVAARVVVIDKAADADAAPRQTRNIDLSDAKDITAFFDRLEDITIPQRAVVEQVQEADGPTRAEAPNRGSATTERQDGDVPTEHTTGKGKTLRGVVRHGVTQEQAKAIDPYTFKKDGGWFIREKYIAEAAPKYSIAPGIDRAQEVPVASIQTFDVAPEELYAKANDWFRENLTGVKVHNESLAADVSFSKLGRGKVTSVGRRDPRRMSVVQALPELVKNGVLVEEDGDRKGRFGLDGYATIVAPVDIDGTTYAVSLKLRRESRENNPATIFYTVAAFNLEGASDGGGGPLTPTGDAHSAAALPADGDATAVNKPGATEAPSTGEKGGTGRDSTTQQGQDRSSTSSERGTGAAGNGDVQSTPAGAPDQSPAEMVTTGRASTTRSPQDHPSTSRLQGADSTGVRPVSRPGDSVAQRQSISIGELLDAINEANRAFSLTASPAVNGIVMSDSKNGNAINANDLKQSLTSGQFGSVFSQLLGRGSVVLHDTASSIPGENHPVGVQAVTMPDGKIHLVASALTPASAPAFLLHEAFHSGVDKLIGSAAWDGLMKRLGAIHRQAAQSSGRAREFYDAARRSVANAQRTGTLPESLTAEEFGAYTIEHYEQAPDAFRKWVDDVIGLVKAWLLRRFGLQAGKVTPAQLRALSVAALEDLAGRQAGARYSLSDSAATPAGVSAEIKENFPGVRIGLYGRPGKPWILSRVEVPGDARSLGVGTAVMGRVISAADSAGAVIALTPSSDFGGDKARLVDFYKRFGFVENKGRNKDFEISETMYRLPSSDPQEGGDARRYSLSADQKGQAVDSASKSLDDAPKQDRIGRVVNDVGLGARLFVHPRTIAAIHPEFTPVYTTAISQMETRDKHIAELGRGVQSYNTLTTEQKANVNKVLELGRLVSETYDADALADGVANTGSRKTVRIGANGKPRVISEPIHAVLTEAGEVVQLNPAEINAYLDLRGMFDQAMDKFRDQTLVEFGFPELAGEAQSTRPLDIVDNKDGTFTLMGKTGGMMVTVGEGDGAQEKSAARWIHRLGGELNEETGGFVFPDSKRAEVEQTFEKELKKSVARRIEDLIDENTPAAQVERVKNIANFIREIEQAKRTGYVPFARYGDYVVTVKEKIADLQFEADGDDAYMVRGVPAELEADMLELGALPEGDGWLVPKANRSAVARLAEKTVYSAKVETELSDFFAKGKGAEKVDDLPSVKAAIEQARKEWVGDNPKRSIVAFRVRDKAPDAQVKMTDVDALAEIANIDNATWDAVRDKLATAIQGRSFRKHFFHSDNVPGYTGDFERAIADYVIGMSGYLSRRAHMKRWDNAINKISEKGKLHQYATKYRGYVNEPQEEFAAVRQVGFFSYIAGVMATAFANMTQVPLLTVPTLSQVAPPQLVMRELTRAYKDAFAMLSRKQGLDLFDPTKAPEDVRGALMEAWDEGAFVPLESFDMMMTARQRNVGRRKLVKGFNDATKAVSIAFTFAERLNRLVTFMAAARLAQKEGVRKNADARLSNDGLARATVLGRNWNPKNFAEWAVDESQYRMGKANRPTTMRGVGAAIMQFKGFMLQTFEAWYRMAALHGPEGKYAAAASLLALYALAGVWGMPGADDLRKLIEAAYKAITDKDLDLKTELRAWVARTSGSNVLAQAVTKGASYPLGVDLTRVGMGSVVPDSPLAAAGIPFDMLIGRPKRAFEKGSSGDYPGAVAEFSPNFIKHWLVAGGWAVDGVRDKSGQRIMGADQLSKTDIAMKTMGFQPSIITDVRDYEYAQRRQETATDALKRKYASQIARTLVGMERAEEAGDRKKVDKLNAELDETYAKLDEHNATAKPEAQIKIDMRSVRQRMQRERDGVMTTWGRERKSAREGAEGLRDLFGLSGKQGEDEGK